VIGFCGLPQTKNCHYKQLIFSIGIIRCAHDPILSGLQIKAEIAGAIYNPYDSQKNQSELCFFI
jgi:hypothetical protein